MGAGCDQAYHTYCVNLSHIPEGTWYCPECSRDWQPPPGTDFGVVIPNSHRPTRRQVCAAVRIAGHLKKRLQLHAPQTRSGSSSGCIIHEACAVPGVRPSPGACMTHQLVQLGWELHIVCPRFCDCLPTPKLYDQVSEAGTYQPRGHPAWPPDSLPGIPEQPPEGPRGPGSCRSCATPCPQVTAKAFVPGCTQCMAWSCTQHSGFV